jgi:hypothetical protein
MNPRGPVRACMAPSPSAAQMGPDIPEAHNTVVSQEEQQRGFTGICKVNPQDPDPPHDARWNLNSIGVTRAFAVVQPNRQHDTSASVMLVTDQRPATHPPSVRARPCRAASISLARLPACPARQLPTVRPLAPLPCSAPQRISARAARLGHSSGRQQRRLPWPSRATAMLDRNSLTPCGSEVVLE